MPNLFADIVPVASATTTYGTRKYQKKLLPEQEKEIVNRVPQIAEAIKVAEGDPERFGVRSIPVSSSEQANKILNNSIYNNYVRWTQAAKPGKFIDFMQKRWAPIGAENDPQNLNVNWAPNVRKTLQKKLGEKEYNKWEGLNLVSLLKMPEAEAAEANLFEDIVPGPKVKKPAGNLFSDIVSPQPVAQEPRFTGGGAGGAWKPETGLERGIRTVEPYMPTVGRLFEAGRRYPRALFTGLEAAQKAEPIIPAIKKGFVPEIYAPGEKVRTPTQISWDMAERVYKKPSTNVAWEFMKLLPYTTAGKLAEFRLDPAIFLTFRGINKILQDPQVAKFMGKEIKAPVWVDKTIRGAIKGFYKPFESLAQGVRENRINALVNEMYVKLEPHRSTIGKALKYKKFTPDDLRGFIKAELMKGGLYTKPLKDIQGIIKGVRKMEPGVKPEVPVKPAPAVAPKLLGPEVKAPVAPVAPEMIKYEKSLAKTAKIQKVIGKGYDIWSAEAARDAEQRRGITPAWIKLGGKDLTRAFPKGTYEVIQIDPESGTFLDYEKNISSQDYAMLLEGKVPKSLDYLGKKVTPTPEELKAGFIKAPPTEPKFTGAIPEVKKPEIVAPKPPIVAKKPIEAPFAKVPQEVSPKILQARQKQLKSELSNIDKQMRLLEEQKARFQKRGFTTGKIDKQLSELSKKYTYAESALAETIVGKPRIEDIQREKAQLKIQDLLKEEAIQKKKGFVIGKLVGTEKEKIRIAELKVEARARKTLRDERRKLVTEMKDLKLGGLPLEYQERLTEIRSGIDLEHLSKRPLASRNSMRLFVEQRKELGEEINIPQEKLDDLEKMLPAEMTTEELRDVHRTVMRLYHLGKLTDKLLTVQKERTFGALVEEGSQAITRGKGLTDESSFVRALRKANPKFKDMSIERITNYLYINAQPELLINMLDAFKSGGISTDVIFNSLFGAESAGLEEGARTIKAIQEIHKKVDITKAMVKKHKVGPYTMTTNQAMDVYANTFNEDNYNDLLASGITDADIQAIEQFLPEEVKQAVRDQIYEYYAKDQGPAIDKVHLELEGVHMPLVEGYFPIMGLEDIVSTKALEQEMLKRYYIRRAAAERGFTKPRVHVKKAFREFDYFGKIMRNWQTTEHYKAYAMAIRDAAKYLNNPTIKASIKQLKGGEKLWNILDKWLKDIAYGGDKTALSSIDTVVRFLRTNFVTSVLGFNIVAASKAPVSFLAGMDLVNNDVLVAGEAAKFMAHPFKMIKSAESKSAVIKYRRFRQEREFREMVARKGAAAKLGQFKLGPAAKEKSLLIYTAFDKATVTIIWTAAYKNVKKTGKVQERKVDVARLEEEARREADRVIRRTQPMGGLLHLPHTFRGPEIQKAYTVFTNQLSKNFNRIYEETLKLHKGKISKARWMKHIIWVVLLPAYLIGLTSRKRPPTKKEYILDAVNQVTGGLFLTGKIVESAGTALAGGYRRGAKALLPAPFGVYEDIESAAMAKTPQKFWKHAVRTALMVTGYPSVEIDRILKGKPYGEVRPLPKEEKEKKKYQFTGGYKYKLPKRRLPKYNLPKYKFIGGR